MAEIVVSRPDEAWANRLRSYEILIDGETAAILPRGGERTVTVGAGHHAVRATIDWGSSPTIDLDLAEADRAYLICQSGFQPSLIRPRALVYVTIWRKRYLDLRLLRVEASPSVGGHSRTLAHGIRFAHVRRPAAHEALVRPGCVPH